MKCFLNFGSIFYWVMSKPWRSETHVRTHVRTRVRVRSSLSLAPGPLDGESLGLGKDLVWVWFRDKLT